MTPLYEKIPDDAEILHCSVHWCGDEECNCWHANIKALKKKTEENNSWHWIKVGEYIPIKTLWESLWLDGYDRENRLELREEIRQACDYYGIKYDLDEEDDYICLVDFEFEDRELP